MMNDRSGMHPEDDRAQGAASASQMPTTPLSRSDPNETLQDDMATVAIPPSAADAPTLATSFHTDPTERGVPPTLQAQRYGQAGAPGNMPQSHLYQGTAPDTAQPGAPAVLYTQSGYASPPAQPGVPMSAPKQRSKLPLIAIVALVVLLLGAGSAFAYVTIQANASTPAKTLQQFCDGLKTQNAQEVYNTFSAEEKAKTSLSQLQQAFDELKNLNLVKFTACTVGEVQQNDTTAVGQITITTRVTLLGISTDTSVTVPGHLVLENGTWKVNSDPTHISNGTFQPNFLTPTVNQ